MQIDLKLPMLQRIIVLDDIASRRQMLVGLLEKQGVTVLAAIGDSGLLAASVAEHAPQAVIISTTTPDAGLLAQVDRLKASGGCPIVLLSGNSTSDELRSAVDAGVNAVIFVGLNGNNLRSAIDLAVADFAQSKSLRSRAADAERALQERKVIERAKGRLMKQRHIDEAVAYDLLRRRAMAQGRRLVDVAQMINDAAEMLIDA